jgi:hypothetical protein
MRFLNTPHTISEYKHQQMPVYETFAAIGTSVGVGIAGSAASYGLSKLMGSGSAGVVPSYNPQQSLKLQKKQFNQMSGQALGFGNSLFNQASGQGIDFAQKGTAANIANQEAVTPGSQAQRQLALNQLNQYIQGQVPQDVQQNINRQVAQNLGGGFNLFSGGGQAPNAFARNIGQTSVGLSQYGLSAANTWQQLANSMVTKPEVGLSAGLQAGQIGSQLASSAAGLGMQNAENQYQGAFNQYQGQQLQNQQNQQLAMQLGQTALQGYDAYNNSKYLNSLSESMQGRLATVGAIPAYTNAPYLKSLGYSAGETPSFGTGS